MQRFKFVDWRIRGFVFLMSRTGYLTTKKEVLSVAIKNILFDLLKRFKLQIFFQCRWNFLAVPWIIFFLNFRFSVLTAFALSEWPNSFLLISHKWVSKKIIFISTNWATYDGKHRTEKFQSYISRNSISSILKNISI